ncbi:AbfB domain-containing protein [Actinoplanes sp. CA-015351]|uniref:AbfB domain-containing protein n=1 Tax=Actinoplanes sp. CA-015351 TaxID=3239897 RepID=UPI003D961F67
MTDPGRDHRRPASTVYGRGGVDVGKSRGLHPGVLALVVIALVVVVAAVGFWLGRSPADEPSPAVPAAIAPASPVTEAAPSPTPERFGAGFWSLGIDGGYLGVDGDLAAVVGDEAVFTVVPGLADDTCFSFRASNGKYLRHFDYRLRFDNTDGSDLFTADATFCARDEQVAGSIRLGSKNYPDHLVHRRGTEFYIDEPSDTGEFTADSTFTVRRS